MDPELSLIQELIWQRTFALRLYLVLGCVFVTITALLLAWVVMRADPPVDKLLSSVPAIFGMVPLTMCFGASEQRTFYRFLKAKWVSARTANDLTEIEGLRSKVQDHGWSVLQKPWWALKT
jgi:hypothetical protein